MYKFFSPMMLPSWSIDDNGISRGSIRISFDEISWCKVAYWGTATTNGVIQIYRKKGDFVQLCVGPSQRKELPEVVDFIEENANCRIVCKTRKYGPSKTETTEQTTKTKTPLNKKIFIPWTYDLIVIVISAIMGIAGSTHRGISYYSDWAVSNSYTYHGNVFDDGFGTVLFIVMILFIIISLIVKVKDTSNKADLFVFFFKFLAYFAASYCCAEGSDGDSGIVFVVFVIIAIPTLIMEFKFMKE